METAISSFNRGRGCDQRMPQNPESHLRSCGALVKRRYESRDILDVFRCQRRMDRQCQCLSGRSFSLRKVAFSVSEFAVTGLEVQRQGIVDLGTHTIFLQPHLKLISPSSANDKLVIDVAALEGGGYRKLHW